VAYILLFIRQIVTPSDHGTDRRFFYLARQFAASDDYLADITALVETEILLWATYQAMHKEEA
jgi:hypothetical protein